MQQQIDLPNTQRQLAKLSQSSRDLYPWIKDEAKANVYAANFGVKIADFKDTNQYEDLIKVISEWRLYLGIKDEMTAVELELNARYLKEEFPDFTLDKIRLAIKYSLKGELKCDIKPYGAFSPLYISTILNAYRRYDQKIVDGVLREKNRLELEEKNKPVVLNEVQKVDSRREYLKWFQVHLNSTDSIVKDFKDVMWNFLVSNGLIDPANLERFDIKDQARKAMEREKNPFELALVTADEWDRVIRYFVLLENRGMISALDIDSYTDEQIMK